MSKMKNKQPLLPCCPCALGPCCPFALLETEHCSSKSKGFFKKQTFFKKQSFLQESVGKLSGMASHLLFISFLFLL